MAHRATSRTRNQARRKTLLLIAASAAAAAMTWGLQAVVARSLGPANFASFMTVWGLNFFLLALVQGIQQEVVRALTVLRVGGTRGTSPTLHAPRQLLLAAFAISFASLALAVVATLGLFPDANPGSMIVVLAICVPVLIAHQMFFGLLGGSELWGMSSLGVILEAAGRFLVVTLVIGLGVGLSGQAGALIVGSLGWLVLALASSVRRALRLVRSLDLSLVYRNSSKSLVATASSAALINAFPVLLQVTSPVGDAAANGALIAAVLMTRAPLMIPVYALQGMLISAFAGQSQRRTRLLGQLWVTISMVTLLGIVVGVTVGPDLLSFAFGEGFWVGGPVLGGLVASAGLTALLTVTGLAVLSTGRLRLYAGSWLTTALTAIGLLSLDLPAEVRTLVALAAAPLAGLLVIGVAGRPLSIKS